MSLLHIDKYVLLTYNYDEIHVFYASGSFVHSALRRKSVPSGRVGGGFEGQGGSQAARCFVPFCETINFHICCNIFRIKFILL